MSRTPSHQSLQRQYTNIITHTHRMIIRIQSRCLQHQIHNLAQARNGCNGIRQFSTSRAQQSKIGRSPLSVPPTVTMTVNPPPPLRRGLKSRRTQSLSTVQVKGPLGEITMPIPQYVKIEGLEGNAPVVSVEDADVRQQREMWGESVLVAQYTPQNRIMSA